MTKNSKTTDSLKTHLARIAVPDPQLGAKEPLEAIEKRLRQALGNSAEQNSFVVGLYGEWGCGKSYWLDYLRYHFTKAEHEAGETLEPVVVPVFFNAWRFEKEAHLIVPLLKTAATEINRWAGFYPDSIQEGIKKKGKELLLSASALAYSFAKTVSDDVLKTNIIGTLEKAKKKEQELHKTLKTDLEKSVEATQALESLYFTFQQRMEGLLSSELANDRKLRLLFLIDDLDRCLPEKAVEMLESIKLFLEVRGTAFVVAIDDEVVERGIIHRYRDYFQQGVKQDDGGRSSILASPITGHEYLEKIVSLPVRIDRPHHEHVQNFIDQEPLCQALSELKKRCEMAEAEDQQLLGGGSFAQVVQIIPPVPRKLIRLAEAFALRKEVLRLAPEKDLLLLRIVALQLFAPEAYRIAQKRRDNILQVLISDFKNKPEYQNQWPSFARVLAQREEKERLENGADEATEDRKNWDQVLKPLLRELSNAQTNRSGFDPSTLVDGLELPPSIDWREYFGEPLAGYRVASTKRSTEALSSQGDIWWQEVEPEGTELETLISELLSHNESSWHSMGSRIGFGQKLGPNAAAALLARAESNFKSFDEKTKKAWLDINCRILLPDTITKTAELMGQQQWAQADQLAATAFDKTSEADAKERAWAGRVLAHIGDNRSGVGVDANGIPQHEFVNVPVEGSAGFYPGFRNQEEAHNHYAQAGMKVNIQDSNIWQAEPTQCDKALAPFAVSQFMVTVRQFKAFFDVASNWIANLQAISGNHENVAQLVMNDQWQSELRFTDPNQPIVNVNWFQAKAYTSWLSQQQGQEFRLLTEREWEWLARRAGYINQDRVFPFVHSGDADSIDWQRMANIVATNIERSSSVGLFPQGAIALEGGAIFDVSGNAWEWSETPYCGYTAGRRDHGDDDWSTVASDKTRVVRGGSWDLLPEVARSAIRFWSLSDAADVNIGFRLARTL